MTHTNHDRNFLRWAYKELLKVSFDFDPLFLIIRLQEYLRLVGLGELTMTEVIRRFWFFLGSYHLQGVFWQTAIVVLIYFYSSFIGLSFDTISHISYLFSYCNQPLSCGFATLMMGVVIIFMPKTYWICFSLVWLAWVFDGLSLAKGLVVLLSMRFALFLKLSFDIKGRLQSYSGIHSRILLSGIFLIFNFLFGDFLVAFSFGVSELETFNLESRLWIAAQLYFFWSAIESLVSLITFHFRFNHAFGYQ